MIKKDFRIYLISGKARHGKSAFGEMILDAYKNNMKKAVIIQYSHYIKEYAIYFFGWDGEEETKPRELLDKIGDVIRFKLNRPHFFIERLLEDIEILSYFFDAVIVDDARLQIEMDIPKIKYGYQALLIRVNRDNFDSELSESEKHHVTETDLDNYKSFDYIINNNGALKDLKRKAEEIVEQQGNI